MILGIILIVFGIVYIIYPDLYRRWIWKKTDIAQQMFSPRQYKIFMRVVGEVFIVAGVFILVKRK